MILEGIEVLSSLKLGVWQIIKHYFSKFERSLAVIVEVAPDT